MIGLLHRIVRGHWPDAELKYAMGGTVTTWCRTCGRMIG